METIVVDDVVGTQGTTRFGWARYWLLFYLLVTEGLGFLQLDQLFQLLSYQSIEFRMNQEPSGGVSTHGREYSSSACDVSLRFSVTLPIIRSWSLHTTPYHRIPVACLAW